MVDGLQYHAFPTVNQLAAACPAGLLRPKPPKPATDQPAAKAKAGGKANAGKAKAGGKANAGKAKAVGKGAAGKGAAGKGAAGKKAVPVAFVMPPPGEQTLEDELRAHGFGAWSKPPIRDNRLLLRHPLTAAR